MSKVDGSPFHPPSPSSIRELFFGGSRVKEKHYRLKDILSTFELAHLTHSRKVQPSLLCGYARPVDGIEHNVQQEVKRICMTQSCIGQNFH